MQAIQMTLKLSLITMLFASYSIGCVPVSYECKTQDDCTGNRVCEQGVCETPKGGVKITTCKSNSDCTGTQTCEQGTCKTGDNCIKEEGLVAYWKFDETSGTIARDSSCNKNDGTIASGVTLGGTGKAGKSFKFNGTKDSHILVKGGLLAKGSAFTFSFWFKTTGNEMPLFSNRCKADWQR